ncbi:MAG TPA: DUF2142 domain-containing protein [Verrucomicrobiae bacterium]|nr:DUF2142 domain-containing protein [Verrucomicrobiae bacterium]
MNDIAAKPPADLSESQERKIIWLLSCLAAIHVFVFSAMFPLFNNVDEQYHFDLVVKYSHGHLPAGLEPVSDEAARQLSFYGTYEYLQSPTNFPGDHFPPPLWTLPDEEVASMLASRDAAWGRTLNPESSQPPLYYVLAGGWWWLMKWCGFGPYGVRFLNVFLMMALVWLGYAAAREVFPKKLFIRLGVPALISSMPQTAFYSINNDVLSPLCFGAVFILMMKLFRAEIPRPGLAAAVGLTLSATFLTKSSNLPLLAVAALALGLKMVSLAKTNKLRASWPSFAALLFCAVLPMAAWLAWCELKFGDITGSTAKIQYLGWTLKPFGEWWRHPIFTPHGFWTFLSGNLKTFWQGEMLWHRKPLRLPAINLIYVFASMIFIATALFSPRPRSASSNGMQRGALWFAFACVAALLAFFGFLSIIYDFHNCFYPSREHPYFTSGRLLLGALIPFALLFVFGMDRALNRFGLTTRFLVLAGLILFMLSSEVATDWPIFFSQYNLFHL